MFSPANIFGRGRNDATDGTGTNSPHEDNATQSAPATPTNRRVSSDANQLSETEERRHLERLLLEEEQARLDATRRCLEGTIAVDEDLGRTNQLSETQKDTLLRRLLRDSLLRNTTSSSTPLAPPSPAFVSSSGEQLPALSSGLRLRALRADPELTSGVLVRRGDRGNDSVARGKVMGQATAPLSIRLIK